MIGSDPPAWRPPVHQPIFNLPKAVMSLAGALVAVHVVRTLLLTDNLNAWVVLALAFIPVRETEAAARAILPGGEAARLWSFVTYGLLHADWGHLIINSVWLAAFGSPLALRFGGGRFLAFSAAGAVAGAAAHLLIYPDSTAPMVGASAAISAHMAAVSRFAFAAGGPMWRAQGADADRRPAEPLAEVVKNRRVLAFLGVWFAVNLMFGLGGSGGGLASGAIAWDAHIGGFLAGLLLFPLFDPVRRA